jgi:hypothetical protein
LLSGRPIFLRYENSQFKTSDKIDESSRILKPPNREEYPYESYEFSDLEEVYKYEEKAKGIESPGILYEKALSIVNKYNDQDQYKTVLLAGDIVWSYFQDKFSTTHYVEIVGDNGSGKSTVGDTFEAIGYRPVNMTDPSAANLFRILGTNEPGQCCIIADEAEKIDRSPEIMSILKTGYHIKKKVAKTNTSTWKQEFYWTYCFKMIIGERSLSRSDAKGVLDRTFRINTYRGKPKHDIKEVLNPQGNPERQRLLDELIDFRKLILIYRLIHFTNSIPDIDIGLDGRDKELCKPLIQLFYNTKAQKEIENALQKFIEAKNQRKESTIEAVLYPIIANLISEKGNEISARLLWESIMKNIEGHWDEKKPNEYQTSEYGIIYRNTITNIICDKFGAKGRHKENGNVLIFNPQKVTRAGRVYDTRVSIQTKLIQDKPEGTEGSECPTEVMVKSLKNNHIVITEIHEKPKENIDNIRNNITNILQEENERDNNITPEPSALSVSSGFMEENGKIYRIKHSDIWACKSCIFRGDIHYMKTHECSMTKKK